MRSFISLALFIMLLFGTGYTVHTGKPDLLSYVDGSGHEMPVRTVAEWKIKRLQILDSMQAAMGELPDRSSLPPLDVRFTDSLKTSRYTRYTILFTAAPNETVPAYLYIPARKIRTGRFPAMLALHETDTIGKRSVDGQGRNPNLSYGKELAERGYVVIAPDYPSFGGLKNYDFRNSRYASGVMKAIFDNMRCIDLLRSRQDVDPDRIGAIGHSLGGHTAMFTAAFDNRIKVTVSSCGWTLLAYYNIGEEASKRYGGRLGPWAQDRYMPLLRTKYHLDPEKIPFDFDEVIAAIAPRAFFSNSPLNDQNFDVNGVKKGIAETGRVYRLLGAENRLRVSYPASHHDFPPAVRQQAYRFLDNMFNRVHTPAGAGG